MSSLALRRTDWLLRGLLVAVFAAAGAMKLAAHPFEVRVFTHFGYPMWFMSAIGLVELAAACALLRRRLVIPSGVVLMVVLMGAMASHGLAGDPSMAAMPAVVLLLILALLVAIQPRLEPQHPAETLAGRAVRRP